MNKIRFCFSYAHFCVTSNSTYAISESIFMGTATRPIATAAVTLSTARNLVYLLPACP